MSSGGRSQRSGRPLRRSFWGPVGWGAVILLLGAGGTAAAAWGLGAELPWLKKPAAKPSLEGLVPVPILAEAVPAYTRLAREHFFNKATGKISYQFLAPQELHPEMILDLGKLFGRVVSRDKAAGYALTSADLAPVGTRPGLVAGIPAGKRSMVLDAARVRGLHALAAGDRCDLLAAVPIPPPPASARRRGGVATPVPPPSAERRRMVVLVQNGLVVKAVSFREPPKGKAGGAAKGVEEVVLAVEPEELAPLSETLAEGTEVVCVARSGRPDDLGAADVTPGSRHDQTRIVELMVGFERDVFVAEVRPDAPFPARPRAPAAEPASSLEAGAALE